ncbi:methylmalonyl-CoA carboxyltransferase [Candidatus Bathyarchaeota archaeon]|nr:MAG: methylmalonyl-CoA carboxyltransferase [Candidatus Bathyarchaeota archaeon]
MSSDKELKEKMLMELQRRKKKVLEMGGAKGIERQRKLGKLTARERLELLFDEGTFVEIGVLVKHKGREFGMDKREIPADAVVTGYGKINGRKVYAFSQDFTTVGGTLGEMHARKICEVLDRAAKNGCPVVGINDSGGARIQEGVDALAGYGQIFFRNTIYSGVIPQICAIIGPCAGGAVYSPALMDFIFMVEGISYAFITGPRVIKEVIGEEVSEMELGGPHPQQEKSGVVHRIEKSEEECMKNIRRLLSYLPSNNLEDPPRVETGDDPNRTDEELFDIVPADPMKPYDMYEIIKRDFDVPLEGEEENYFDILSLFAPNIITCFARLNGYPVGIIANQPKVKAGCLDIDASDKASRFIRFCDAFNIPLINLVDVPGYLPGTEQEWGGIIRHGAKMLYAYSEATVPKITLVIRKAYGGSYLAMCSKDLGADVVLAWPTAELAVMGPEGAAPIIFREEIEKAPDKKKALEEKIKLYRETFANPYKAAESLHIDDVINPAETRPMLIKALEFSLNKRERRPPKKHGIPPV